jgi:hypothetical protein
VCAGQQYKSWFTYIVQRSTTTTLTAAATAATLTAVAEAMKWEQEDERNFYVIKEIVSIVQ